MGYSKPYLPLGIASLRKNPERVRKEGLPEALFLWELPYYHFRQLPKNISLEKFMNNIKSGMPTYVYGDLRPDNPFFGGVYSPNESYAVKISPTCIEISTKSENVGDQILKLLLGLANKSVL
jgi:hypothetical protein